MNNTIKAGDIFLDTSNRVLICVYITNGSKLLVDEAAGKSFMYLWFTMTSIENHNKFRRHPCMGNV